MIKLVKNEFFIYCKETRIESNRSFYGSFSLGPFDTGLSITIANALRRTLLSELKGLAITSAEIEGAFHEYSTLPGVRDSILDILLNLKDIVLKTTNYGNKKRGCTSIATFKKTQIGYLKSRGPGIITASELKLPPGIQCVDPDQYIATLSEEGILNIKIMINEGKNYVIQSSYSQNKDQNQNKRKAAPQLVSRVGLLHGDQEEEFVSAEKTPLIGLSKKNQNQNKGKKATKINKVKTSQLVPTSLKQGIETKKYVSVGEIGSPANFSNLRAYSKLLKTSRRSWLKKINFLSSLSERESFWELERLRFRETNWKRPTTESSYSSKKRAAPVPPLSLYFHKGRTRARFLLTGAAAQPTLARPTLVQGQKRLSNQEGKAKLNTQEITPKNSSFSFLMIKKTPLSYYPPLETKETKETKSSGSGSGSGSSSPCKKERPKSGWEKSSWYSYPPTHLRRASIKGFFDNKNPDLKAATFTPTLIEGGAIQASKALALPIDAVFMPVNRVNYIIETNEQSVMSRNASNTNSLTSIPLNFQGVLVSKGNRSKPLPIFTPFSALPSKERSSWSSIATRRGETNSTRVSKKRSVSKKRETYSWSPERSSVSKKRALLTTRGDKGLPLLLKNSVSQQRLVIKNSLTIQPPLSLPCPPFFPSLPLLSGRPKPEPEPEPEEVGGTGKKGVITEKKKTLFLKSVAARNLLVTVSKNPAPELAEPEEVASWSLKEVAPQFFDLSFSSNQKDKGIGAQTNNMRLSENQTKIPIKNNIIIEIWTNGSIHPRQALYEACKNLLSLFSKLEKATPLAFPPLLPNQRVTNQRD